MDIESKPRLDAVRRVGFVENDLPGDAMLIEEVHGFTCSARRLGEAQPAVEHRRADRGGRAEEDLPVVLDPHLEARRLGGGPLGPDRGSLRAAESRYQGRVVRAAPIAFACVHRAMLASVERTVGAAVTLSRC